MQINKLDNEGGMPICNMLVGRWRIHFFSLFLVILYRPAERETCKGNSDHLISSFPSVWASALALRMLWVTSYLLQPLLCKADIRPPQ